MKTLLLIFLLPTLTFSQVFVSTEVDPKNAIIGSEKNPPAYDGILNIGFRDQSFQIQASYENFKAIDFYSMSVKSGYVFRHEKDLNLVLLGGLGWIQRNVDWLEKVLFLSSSISGQIEYHFGLMFFLARSEIRYRGDLGKPIYSGYIGIGIELFKNK